MPVDTGDVLQVYLCFVVGQDDIVAVGGDYGPFNGSHFPVTRDEKEELQGLASVDVETARLGD